MFPCIQTKAKSQHQSSNTNQPYINNKQIVLLEIRYFIFVNDSLVLILKIQSTHSPSIIMHEISPIIQAKIHFPITPVFDRSKSDSLRGAINDDLDNFCLYDSAPSLPQKKTRKSRPRLSSTYHVANNQLENIIEDEQDEYYNDFESESDQISEKQNGIQSQGIYSESEQDQMQGQKQSNTNYQLSSYEFKNAEWQALNPKKQLVTKIKGIVIEAQTSGNQQKFTKVKQVIIKYLCDYQKIYFEESMNNIRKIHSQIVEVVDIVLKGIDQTFKRIIGGLSFEKRRIKLLRYLDKKKRRVWKKKVNYDCRKKVADGRLRIKGKFVTNQQACQQLGLTNLEGYSPEDIKQMLYKKMEQN